MHTLLGESMEAMGVSYEHTFASLSCSSWYRSLQCGHVACQTCLLVLFSRALAQHMGRYPTYDMRVADVHPQYRCPECQSEIKRAPIEVHPLKDLAAFIAQLKGETEASPQDSVVALRNTGPVSVHPFSEYFTC